MAPAAVKETRYFLPARYGQPLEPVGVYEDYFRDAGDRPIRLEATPAYFYGDTPLIDAMREALGPARVIVVLREPVSRLVSFFTSQKARLRIPEDMTLAAYLEEADRLTADDFLDPANEPFFGFRGGLYADHLPLWLDAYGPDLRVLFFDDLIARPADLLDDVAVWLGIDPEAFPAAELSSENRTTGFRNRGAQRFALAFNDRFEKFLRRHHGLKDRLRSAYYRLNGQSARASRFPTTCAPSCAPATRTRMPGSSNSSAGPACTGSTDPCPRGCRRARKNRCRADGERPTGTLGCRGEAAERGRL